MKRTQGGTYSKISGKPKSSCLDRKADWTNSGREDSRGLEKRGDNFQLKVILLSEQIATLRISIAKSWD